MNKYIYSALIAIILGLSNQYQAQNVGINGTGAAPDASAILDVVATNKGLLIPRFSIANANAAAPVTAPASSLLVYNTNAAITNGNGVGYYFWDGVKWVKLLDENSTGAGWELLGNAGTNPTTNFLGTTDNQDLVLRTNSVENFRINTSGNIDVGAGLDDARIYARILNTDATTNYGAYIYHDGVAGGTTYGTRTINYTSTNSTKYGLYNYTNSEGTGGRYGIYNNTYLNTASNSFGYGIRNYLSTYGTGSQYGIYNYVLTNAASSTGTVYGLYNYISSNGTGTHYGIYSNVPGGTNDYSGMFYAGNFVANEVGGNYDFRIESDGNTNMFFLDASSNMIGIGTGTPTAELTMNGWIGRTAHENGALAGSYNSVGANSAQSNPIYIIGTNYKPLAATLGNMYGTGYTHTNASFIASTQSSWGEYIAADGDARVWLAASNLGNSYFNTGGNVGVNIVNPTFTMDVYNTGTTAATLVYRGRNASAIGTRTQIGSIEYFEDYSSTIDFSGGSNFSINLNASAAYDLQLAINSAAKPGSNVWTVASDARLKEDINPFKEGLSTLRNIKPVYFKYNGKANIKEEHYFVGVVAQELETVAPYMVGSFESAPGNIPFEEQASATETYKSVDNGAMTYIAINAIKELDEGQSKLREAIINISDFGMASLTADQTFVPFGDEFKNMLTGIPIVTITPINSLSSLTIVSQTKEGFTVKINGDFDATSFNWIAMAKIKNNTLINDENYSNAERQMMIAKIKAEKAVIDYDSEYKEAALRKKQNSSNQKVQSDGIDGPAKVEQPVVEPYPANLPPVHTEEKEIVDPLKE